MPEKIDYDAEDLDVATRTLWGECRGEILLGQQAVSWVIRNRAEWPKPVWWGDGVMSVCLKPMQFSCWNSNCPEHPKDLQVTDPEYVVLSEVVRAVFAGEIDDPTGGATHYEVLGTGAAWAKNREFSKIIGRHAFYVIGPGA